MQDWGYRVILAHPERCLCLRENMKFIRQLHDSGAMLQLNADSVLGFCGWRLKRFCRDLLKAELADVITPNLTEAAFLLGMDYGDLPRGEAGLRQIVRELSMEGKRSVALTGASLAPGKTGAMCFDAATGETEAVQTDFIAHPLHGTGDVFASVLTGGLVKGKSLTEAAREAVAFIRACAVRTVEQNLPMREGVDFEPLLGLLTERSGQA